MTSQPKSSRTDSQNPQSGKATSDTAAPFVSIANTVAKDEKVPPQHRGPLYLSIVIAILCAGACAGLFALHQPQLALVALALTFLVLLVIAFGILPRLRRGSSQKAVVTGNRNRTIQTNSGVQPADQFAKVKGDDNETEQSAGK